MRDRTLRELRKSGFIRGAKPADLLASRPGNLGQRYPQHCPRPEEVNSVAPGEPLGTPLSIREVAILIGCSPWTVRQRYLPAGLPHMRLGRNGKLIFYKNQIIRWLLLQQQKGGIP